MQQAMQNDQGALRYFKRNQFLFREGIWIADLVAHTALIGSHPTRLQSETMTPGDHPETAVIYMSRLP